MISKEFPQQFTLDLKINFFQTFFIFLYLFVCQKQQHKHLVLYLKVFTIADEQRKGQRRQL